MIPINKLLSRIQRDREFGRGLFELGYYDRILDAIIRVPLSAIIPADDDRHSIRIMDNEGIVHSIPLHRIKEVYKNNELIWHRQH